MNKNYRIRWTSQRLSFCSNDELMHFGIKGQKWGVRRFQNDDGTLTEDGRKRYMTQLNSGHGRKMSLVGRIKFGKEITEKTEADEESRARNSIAAQNGDITGVDYKTGNGVSEYVQNIHKKYLDSARKDSVWKQHQIGQDTAYDYIQSNQKFKKMIDHILDASGAANKEAVQASADFQKSRENANKPGPKFENMNRSSVKYWDTMNESAEKYIQKNFTGDDADVARALIYWYFIDW